MLELLTALCFVTVAFSGCMRNVKLGVRDLNFARRGGAALNANLEGCPRSVTEPVRVCADPKPTDVYSGYDRKAFDHDLEFFSGMSEYKAFLRNALSKFLRCDHVV